MLKPLTLSVSLAVALGACSVSMAGLHGGGCGLASSQCPAPSAQCSPQSTCGSPCAAKKPCCLSGLFKHKPKTVCYEWVLKKKHCGGLFGHGGGSCSSCGTSIMASGQCASPQASGQVYGAGQAYGAAQAYGAGQAMAPAATGDEAPPAPAETPAPPAPATPPAANAPQSSLLFLAPAGN